MSSDHISNPWFSINSWPSFAFVGNCSITFSFLMIGMLLPLYKETGDLRMDNIIDSIECVWHIALVHASYRRLIWPAHRLESEK